VCDAANTQRRALTWADRACPPLLLLLLLRVLITVRRYGGVMTKNPAEQRAAHWDAAYQDRGDEVS
jgi:hypothetical protein